MNDRVKKIILAALLLAVFLAAAVWAYNHCAKTQPVTYEPQQQAETPQGVQTAANNAGVHVSPDQAQEVAQAVQEAKPWTPDQVIQTTGAGMTQALANVQQQTGAQVQIVTDPAKPDKPPDKPKPEESVNLNVYNVKAYPKRMLEVTVYRDAADVAYMTRVTVFKRTGYLGPVVSYDADRAGEKVRIGARLTIPLD
ncbi:hypothetical protein [Anaeroselena agilis]|uniref:Uncharacterized protein n=1 Tax=Anaeroselena agilis TaxID=3063788 RepID=A0ABU3NYE0_9FIRM|nr:hypothetical protein [Selenomonadales bacterium 4137-cl]